jgi:hypothetical protein
VNKPHGQVKWEEEYLLQVVKVILFFSYASTQTTKKHAASIYKILSHNSYWRRDFIQFFLYTTTLEAIAI